MKSIKNKLIFLLVLVLLINLLLPGMSAFAAETNDFVIPGDLNKKSTHTLFSPETSNWGNQASTPQSNSNSNLNQAINKEEAIANEILNSVSDDEVQSYGLKKIAAKTVIKRVSKILRNNVPKLTNWLSRYTGGSKSIKEAINVINKYSTKIADVLDELLTWSEVPLKAIEDRITGKLTGLGVPYSTAKLVGYWIKTIVDWGIF